MATAADRATVAPGRSRVWRRALDTVDDRLGLEGLRYEVPEHANNLAWSLGGLTAFSFLVLLVTGIFLVQFYNPTPDAANQSIRDLQNGVTMGAFVRGIHFWAAQAMYVLAGLHLLRVFLTGSYKKPREANWLIGVAMFALVIGAMFTGTVLKWDQEGFEDLDHNLEISKVLGGVGTFFGSGFASNVPIIVRLYGAHVAMIPGLILALMATHFLLVKRHKISPHPDNPQGSGERTGPFTLHMRRVATFGLLLLGVLGLLSLLVPPGIGPSPVAGVEVTKPPWMFWWMFGLENYLGIKGILYGTVAFFGIHVALPFLDRRPERRWRKRRVAMVGLGVLVAVMGWLSYVTATSGMTNHLG
jgi:ubiquinol-cytochrome c reductase cytochrome b subunit